MRDYRAGIDYKAARFEQLLEVSPEAGVIACRQIAEMILGHIYQDFHGEAPKLLEFDLLFKGLSESKRKRGPIRRQIKASFATIQSIGNQCSHVYKAGSPLTGRELKTKEIKLVRSATHALLDWFEHSYPREENPTSPPEASPQPEAFPPPPDVSFERPQSALLISPSSLNTPFERPQSAPLIPPNPLNTPFDRPLSAPLISPSRPPECFQSSVLPPPTTRAPSIKRRRSKILTILLALLGSALALGFGSYSLLQHLDPFALYNATPIEWISIKGGVFRMGSVAHEPDERPVHEVHIADFKLSRAEITVAQYARCVEAGVCAPPHTGEECNWGHPERTQHPVNCVDWSEARAFARWVNARLPSEAEWEYAARSRGRDIPYPWGWDEPTCDRAVFSMRGYAHKAGHGCGQRATWPTCSKPKGVTAQGLCDMGGNVWEWVEDEKCPYPATSRDGKAARCNSPYAVLRGGSWANNGHNLRTRDRLKFKDPGNQYVGFRIAR